MTACAGIETAVFDLQATVDEIDLEGAVGSLTDCDELSDAFVNLVGATADRVDDLAESTGTQIPIGDLREIVDELAVSRYYDIAEQLGCAKLQMELSLVEKLIDLQADTNSGENFLDEVLEEVQSPNP